MTFATKRARDWWLAVDRRHHSSAVTLWRDRIGADDRDILDAERADGAERYFVDIPVGRRVYVSVYLRTLRFGGSEEGGWYYDELLLDDDAPGFAVDNTVDEVADAVGLATEWATANGPTHDYHSVLGGWDFQIVVELRRGSNATVQRPRWS